MAYDETTSDEPARPGAGPLQTPRVRALLWGAPYGLVVLAAGFVHPLLALAGAFVSALVYGAYERLHRHTLWRYPAGWLLALLLLVPCLYFIGYSTPWPAVLLGLPALVLWLLDRATNGWVARFLAPQPLFGSLLYALLVAATMFTTRGFAMPPPTDDVLFAVYAAPKAEPLDQEGMEQAVEVVVRTLERFDGPDEDDAGPATAAGPFSVDQVSPALRAVTGRDVWVTLWLPGEQEPLRGRSSEGAVFANLSRATWRALASTPRWPSWVESADRVRIQIDLGAEPVPVSRRWIHPLLVAGIAVTGPVSRRSLWRLDLGGQLLYEVEPGIDGLMLRSGDREAVLLPSDPVTHGWLTPRVKYRTDKLDELLARLSSQAGGPAGLWSQAGSELYKFRSFSFGRLEPGARHAVRPLYRANVLGEVPRSDTIVRGIGAAGRWLSEAVMPDGRFRYEYFANQDHYPDAYNAVRHAGCVYGLFFLYHLALREDELRSDAHGFLEAAIRSAGWLYPRLRAPEGASDRRLVALVDDQGGATSGAAALTLLGFVERPSPELVNHPVLRERLIRPEDERIVEGLGRFVLSMIDDQGKVFHNYRQRTRHDRVVDEPLYFPGEVMLALARLYRATGEPRWLEGATRVGEARIARYYRERPNPDHWVMQALWELYDLTGDERYAECGLDMGDRHAFEQFPPQWPPFEDYRGAYRRADDLPRTTRACSRSEAMGGVVQIAWRLGTDAQPYENALLRAADHLLENQWRPDNAFYLPNPERAYGAIRMGLVDNHCRIDNNQHALVGLAHALRVARRREGVGAADAPVLPARPTAETIRACRQRFAMPSPGSRRTPVPTTP